MFYGKLEYNLGNVKCNVTGAGDHLPALDVRIRRVKEVIRATLTHVFFVIPMSKIMYLVYYAVSRMNMRQTDGRSDGQCPWMAFKGKRPNWSRELGIVFGDVCECAVPGVVTNDAMTSRTSAHIAMCPTGNDSGSWIFWSIVRNTIVRRSKWVVMHNPVQDILDACTALAKVESDDPNFVLCSYEDIEDDETEDMLDDLIFTRVYNPARPNQEQSFDRVGVSNVNSKSSTKKRGRPKKVRPTTVTSSSTEPVVYSDETVSDIDTHMIVDTPTVDVDEHVVDPDEDQGGLDAVEIVSGDGVDGVVL